MQDHPVIVAGSTWEEDEEELDHYANTHPGYYDLLLPHMRLKKIICGIWKPYFDNTIRYSVLEKQLSVNSTIKRSAVNQPDGQPNVLIIDNIGMLARLYSYAEICYVGGGFGDDGVHNVLEAAVYGKPVITGPVIEKYIEVMELADAGGVIIIDNALEAESVFSRLFENQEEYAFHGKAARNYVYARQGSDRKNNSLYSGKPSSDQLIEMLYDIPRIIPSDFDFQFSFHPVFGFW